MFNVSNCWVSKDGEMIIADEVDNADAGERKLLLVSQSSFS